MIDPAPASISADLVSSRLLKELSSINYRFLVLLCASNDTLPQLGMPVSLQERLITLSGKDHKRLASCPYSLFDLRLSDAPLWQELASKSVLSGPPVDAHTSRFALGAMIYAQWLATENADLGRLLLGLSRKVAQVLSSMSIGQLMDRSEVAGRFLRVRLINDPNFWPDLVNYVREGTQEQYLAAQTSALQLMAARRGVWPGSGSRR